MYIRDENHPIKQVQGFDYDINITRNYQSLQQAMDISGVKKEVLGRSSDGRYDIVGLSFGDLSGKVLFMTGGIHAGTEWVACYFLLNFFKALHNPSLYPTQRRYLELIMKNYDGVYIVPCINPSGFVNGTRENANGIDLNRNFNLSNPEKETEHIKAILRKIKPELYIDCHERGRDGVGIAGVDNIRGNLDNHYIKKVYTSIRYLTHLGNEFANYHGGTASAGEMRRWVISNLSNRAGKGVPSYIVEAGNSSRENTDVKLRYNRGLNALFAVLLANHLLPAKYEIYGMNYGMD